NWYKDDWMILGSQQSEFTDVEDRKALERACLIEQSDLSCALICPEHSPAIAAFLEKLRAPNQTEPETQADVTVQDAHSEGDSQLRAGARVGGLNSGVVVLWGKSGGKQPRRY